MVDRRLSDNKTGHVCRDLLPTIVLHNLALTALRLALRRRIIGSPCSRNLDIGVRNTSGPDLKRLAHEFVLGIDLLDFFSLGGRCIRLGVDSPRRNNSTGAIPPSRLTLEDGGLLVLKCNGTVCPNDSIRTFLPGVAGY